MKKGFLFSLMTFLLLFSLIILSVDYVNRSKQLQNSLSGSRFANRMVYIEDDVVAGSLDGLTGIEVNEIKRNSPSLLLNFRGGSMDGVNYSARAEVFSDFVNLNYSVLSNLEIELQNYSAGFYVQPFNSSYQLETDKAWFITDDFEKLNGIEIIVRLGVGQSQLVSSSTPSGSGDRNITLRAYDSAGLLIIDETTNLNPSLQNSPFILDFGYGRVFEVLFGDYGWNAALIMNATGLSADIAEIIIDYDYTSEEVVISNGRLNIYSPVDGITKQTEIVLKKG